MRRVIALTLLVWILFTALYVLTWTIESVSCNDTGSQTGVPSKYSPLSGCYVRPGDRWVPISAWRELIVDYQLK